MIPETQSRRSRSRRPAAAEESGRKQEWRRRGGPNQCSEVCGGDQSGKGDGASSICATAGSPSCAALAEPSNGGAGPKQWRRRIEQQWRRRTEQRCRRSEQRLGRVHAEASKGCSASCAARRSGSRRRGAAEPTDLEKEEATTTDLE
ncbi:hypothetical protein Scep_025641 [Stephania cephalantha]|uniref:Uncharacterized protein n=1 Tax=Stephania cephalantha TaxID=152367 RepID=A0AAP0ENV0_9MAGN